MPLLELRDVSKAFGGLQVIDHLTLHVDDGEIVSVIGPNGAGKTTLYNLITGVYRPMGGDILLDGKSLVGLSPHAIAKRGVGRTFQTLRLFLNMTVKENVMVPTWAHTHSGVFRSALYAAGLQASAVSFVAHVCEVATVAVQSGAIDVQTPSAVVTTPASPQETAPVPLADSCAPRASTNCRNSGTSCAAT